MCLLLILVLMMNHDDQSCDYDDDRFPGTSSFWKIFLQVQPTPSLEGIDIALDYLENNYGETYLENHWQLYGELFRKTMSPPKLHIICVLIAIIFILTLIIIPLLIILIIIIIIVLIVIV